MKMGDIFLQEICIKNINIILEVMAMKKYKIIFSFLVIFLLILLLFQSNLSQAKSPFEVEIGTSYSHSSNNRLNVSGYSVVEVVNVGKLEVRKIRRDILTSNLKLRYKNEKSSLELVIPYQVQRENIIKYADTTENGEPTEEIKTSHGIGDITVNLQTDLRNENTKFNLGIKTTTGKEYGGNTDLRFGTNYYGIKVGVSHIKQIDPVVLFGSTNYFWNIEKNNFNPGDTFQYSLGLAYALSQNLSINTRIEHSITTSTFQKDKKIIGSSLNSSSIYLGTSYVNQKESALDFLVGVGLSEDSADFSFKINKPYYF